MGIVNMPKVRKGLTVDELAGIVAQYGEQLEYVINGFIDGVNIRANSITTKLLAAGAVTADKITVTELSAISADLGKVIAGILIGAYISTADGTFPRIDFSSGDNLLKAMQSATNYIAMSPNLFGPVMEFNNGVVQAIAGVITALSNTFFITSTEDINISASGNLTVTSSAGTISDLVTAINGLSSSISSLNSNKANHGNTSLNGTHDHGIPDGTQLLDADGVTVHTFSQMGAHVHTI